VDPDRWASLKAHFEKAADLPPEERAEYVRRLEESDPEMGAWLQDMLQHGSTESADTETAGPADHPVRAFRVGEVLDDRFEIEEFLGEGGAGQVFRAYDRHRQIQIALKALRPALAGDSSAVATLRNELNTATRVSSPHVCRLYDIKVSPLREGPSFITMELLSGELLSARIRKGALAEIEARATVEQIAEGLEAAHACDVVHRDLKPGNVFLVPSKSGVRAVITDFGLAQTIEPDADLTVTMGHDVVGTPAYMAPEQIEGTAPTKAVDIHALGVIMFEMVTGRRPFEGGTALAVAAARLHSEAPSPRQYQPALDERWERTILACLERDPARRPASASQVLALLDQPAAKKWPRRTAVAALGTAVALGAYVIGKPERRNPEAEAAFQQGLLFSQRRTAEGMKNAIQEFRRATELDPRWATAWANLADAYGAASNAEVMDPAAGLALAQAAARRAVSLDDGLARAHGSLAWALSLDLDGWPKAEAEFRRALQLDGKDPDVRRWFAVYLRKLGRFRQAEQEVRAGMQLTHTADPRFLSELAFLFFTARQPERFKAQVEEAHRLFPDDALVESLVAKSLELEGRFSEALEVLNFVERLGMNPALVLVLKAGLAASRSDRWEARRLAGEVERMWLSKPVDGLVLAGVYARLGDGDQAFRTLEQAYRRRDDTLLSLATSPWMDPLRTDRRFHQWLLRLHFTDQIMQRMEFRLSSLSGSLSQPSRTGVS